MLIVTFFLYVRKSYIVYQHEIHIDDITTGTHIFSLKTPSILSIISSTVKDSKTTPPHGGK